MAQWKPYHERLRDPRWQRKRLEIMDRDRFACQFCLAKDKTLNVHHGFYAKGRDPWDYPDESLLTLCEECHAVTEQSKTEAHAAMALLDGEGLRRVAGYAAGLRAFELPVDSRSVAYIPDYEFLIGFLNALGLRDVDAVLNKVNCAYPGKISLRWLDELQGAEYVFLRDSGRITK